LKSKLHENTLYAKQSLNYKHIQWRTHHHFETTTDTVIAKGPEVMPDTVARKCHSTTGLLADHAECSQLNAKTTPSTENTSSSSLTKLNYI